MADRDLRLWDWGRSATPTATSQSARRSPRNSLLDDNVEKVVISPSDPEICEISTTELTESGTVTYTPLEAGEAHFFITFHLTDGTAYPLTNSYFIEED